MKNHYNYDNWFRYNMNDLDCAREVNLPYPDKSIYAKLRRAKTIVLRSQNNHLWG